MTDNEIRRDMITAGDDLIKIMRSELMGPGSEFDFPDKEHELISSSPLSRYSVGILFPQGNCEGQDNNETISSANNDAEELIVDISKDNIQDEANQNIFRDSEDSTKDDGDTDLDDITDKILMMRSVWLHNTNHHQWELLLQ